MAPVEDWHAFEIFDYTMGDGLLTDVVGPVVREHGLEFFFIRYWAGGPHVRLRMRSCSRTETLRSSLERHATQYFRRVRGPADFDEERFCSAQASYAAAEGVKVPPMIPHGTIRTSGYTPEQTKYGGPEGVVIAEGLFHLSSALVLDLLDGRASASRNELCIVMMVAALNRAGFTPRAMVAFLNGYADRWSHHLTHESWQGWPDRAARDRNMVGGGVRDAALGRAPLGCAISWARTVRESLVRLAESGAHKKADGGARSVLIHYLHTHNNRLGISPSDEAYLAWLAASLLAGSGQADAPE